MCAQLLNQICLYRKLAYSLASSAFLPVVPQTLLREADPYLLGSTSSPPVETDKGSCFITYTNIISFNSFRLSTTFSSSAPPTDLEEPFSKESKRPDHSGAMSSSLLTYAYVTGKNFPLLNFNA